MDDECYIVHTDSSRTLFGKVFGISAPTHEIENQSECFQSSGRMNMEGIKQAWHNLMSSLQSGKKNLLIITDPFIEGGEVDALAALAFSFGFSGVHFADYGLMSSFACGAPSCLVAYMEHRATVVFAIVDSEVLFDSSVAVHVGCADYREDNEAAFFEPQKETLALHEAILHCVQACDADKRQMLLSNVILTGLIPSDKGFEVALIEHVSKMLVISPFASEMQPRVIRLLKIPEYFAGVKDHQRNAPFIGASVVAQTVFHDPKNYISRAEYEHANGKVADLRWK